MNIVFTILWAVVCLCMAYFPGRHKAHAGCYIRAVAYSVCRDGFGCLRSPRIRTRNGLVLEESVFCI